MLSLELLLEIVVSVQSIRQLSKSSGHESGLQRSIIADVLQVDVRFAGLAPGAPVTDCVLWKTGEKKGNNINPALEMKNISSSGDKRRRIKVGSGSRSERASIIDIALAFLYRLKKKGLKNYGAPRTDGEGLIPNAGKFFAG